MTTLLEAAKQAVKLLDSIVAIHEPWMIEACDALELLESAIEQAEKQEPVASVGDLTIRRMNQAFAKGHQSNTPLYTHSGKPAQQTLRDEEIKQVKASCKWTFDDYECSWDGTCGVKWSFLDGGPKENDVNFCPRCGMPVEIGVQHE